MPRTPQRMKPDEHAGLLEALDADQVVEVPDDPIAVLQLAVMHARRGDFTEARTAVDRALDLAPVAVVRIVAGIVLYVTRDYDRALRCFREAGPRAPAVLSAQSLALARANRLGWTADAREALEALTEIRPKTLRSHVEVARMYAQSRAWAPALEALRRACEIESTAAALWIERAAVAALHPTSERTHRRREVAECVAGAMRVEPVRSRRHLPLLLEAARVSTQVGLLTEAEAHLQAARELVPDAPEPILELGERALWRGDHGAARDAAERVLGWGVEQHAARRILGGIAVREARLDEALRLLPVDTPDYRGQLWRGEALLGLGRLHESHEALTRASMGSDGFLSVAWVLRLRLSLRDNPTSRAFQSYRFGEVRDLLLAVDADGSLGAKDVLEHGRYEDAEALFVAVLERLGGNRSTMPTVCEHGELRRLPPLEGEREASRRALEQIRASRPEHALAELEAVARRFEGHALPDAHRGELLLWLGRYEESRQALERSIGIQAETRWPYIGLSCLDIVEGDPERALATSTRGIRVMKGTVGAAVHVHEGEALRRLGRIDEALQSLEKAVALHPDRLSAKINLVLAKLARGDDVSVEIDDVLVRAPGLVSDAAASLGVALWDRRDARPETETARAVLEKSLELMRGNRSSSILTYVTDEGRLRYVPRAKGQRRPHDGDRDDLMRARGMLMKAAGLGEEHAIPAPAPDPPKGLSPEQLETFLRRGFIKIEGALDGAVAREWRERATTMIRRAPERYVKGYRGEPLDRFDPADPVTWCRERIDCELDASWPFAQVMPEAWTAICALLGGEERISTPDVGEYLILNIKERAQLGAVPPHRSWESWHMDDPSRQTSLSDFRNGLVLIVLFDDVELERGPTYIAPESVREVSRVLAKGPTDFVDRTVTQQIMQRCEERVALTGKVGDVYVMHPFMLHSSSPNPSGRVRWMANPVVYVHDALRFEAPAASPVEEVVVRALRD